MRRSLCCLALIIPVTVFGVWNNVVVDANGDMAGPDNAFRSIVLNGQRIDSWTNCTVTNLLVNSNWSIWVANTNVDIGNFNVTNANGIYGQSLSIAGSAAVGVDVTASTLSATTVTVTYLSAPGGILKVKD